MSLTFPSRRRRDTQPAARRSPARLEALEDRTLFAFSAPVMYPTGAATVPGPYAVAVADFNGDGAADLAVANCLGNPSSIAILVNNGNGTFQKPQTYAVKYAARAIGVGDFDGDKRPDVVVTGDNRVTVFLNPAKGGWKVGQDLTLPAPAGTLGQTAGSLAVGDVNGDGRPDVAVTSLAFLGGPDHRGYTHVLLSSMSTSTAGGRNGKAAQTSQTGLLSVQGTVPISPVLTYFELRDGSAGTNTWTAVGDFDKDGRQEILASVAFGWTPPVTQMTGLSATGALRTPVAVAPGGAVAVADFDRDSNLDFIAGAQVQLGHGDGTFTVAQDLSSGTQSVAVGDFNGDQLPDLATADGNDFLVGAYLGNGDGTFRYATDAPLGGSYALATGDFNRDGWADLVGLTFGWGTLGAKVSLNDQLWA
jgi:hypothetical protein